MLSELFKSGKTMEIPTRPLEERDIEDGGHILQQEVEVIEGIPELTESMLKEVSEGTRILQPNMEAIKSQSLESIKQSNIEKLKANVSETANSEYRPLTEEEAKKLKELTNLPDSVIESIMVAEDGTLYLKCRNAELAGEVHEVTGVPYVEKTIVINGVEITVVVPEFPYVFAIDIPKEFWEAGDRELFKKCTEELRKYLEEHPEMRENFTEQQLQQIENGEPYIKGYTWHHTEVPGKMQLVETKTHALSGHTGGNAIWCGGVR